ncbi:hypothetical protein [Arcobacter arenosus]|jgi:hypothetical protein|uniref:Uncharacterized protein n=1 Tax=Arcobacter arenosus TaxID=2576037 RepID=A0A5R8XY45_9BACT|nr:hypothetical protein [Arcobacter arenosus]TLP36260.1 hypothetical protein FDK22_13410 [Arcobacter arenosus]
MEKQKLIEEIKKLIGTDENDIIDINPNFLEYFQEYELEAIKDDLILKKSQIRESTFDFLDEIYEKTKEN